MPCTIQLSLLEAGGDNPMDAAVYHPTRQSFFAVRGGYISEWTTALTLKQGPTRFAAGCFGRSCITYDQPRDRLWVGTNGDWAAGYLGDTGGAQPAKSTVGLYRIIPATLSLEAFVDVTALTYTPFVGGNQTNMGNLGSDCGVCDVLIGNSRLFFAAAGIERAPLQTIRPQGYMAFLNLPSYTAGSLIVGFGSANMQLALDNLSPTNQIWVGQDDDNFIQDVIEGFPNDGSSVTGPAPNQPTNGAHVACCFSPVNSFIYQIDMPNLQAIKINITTGLVDSYHNLTGSTIGGMTSKIRFNSNDNLIYIPCPATNQMIAYNPANEAGNPVSHIYTAGLDSPHDFVGAPGGIKVAVQQGSAGLVQLTT